MQVKVLGFDCASCRKTFTLIEQVATDLGLNIDLVKTGDAALLARHQVLSVPAILVEDELKFQGGCPDVKAVRQWLQAAKP